MKKLIALILAMVLALSLVACDVETSKSNKYTRFVTVERKVEGPWYSADILVDMETGVTYLFFRDGYAGGVCTLINADGTPIIWEGYKNVG